MFARGRVVLPGGVALERDTPTALPTHGACSPQLVCVPKKVGEPWGMGLITNMFMIRMNSKLGD